jgi:hypothetical protein
MICNEENNVDLLSQNYKEMNETGKEKLKEVSDLILDIWNTVNEDKSPDQPVNKFPYGSFNMSAATLTPQG